MAIAKEETFGPVAPIMTSATSTRRSPSRTRPTMASRPPSSRAHSTTPGMRPRSFGTGRCTSTRRRTTGTGWRRSAGRRSRGGPRARRLDHRRADGDEADHLRPRRLGSGGGRLQARALDEPRGARSELAQIVAVGAIGPRWGRPRRRGHRGSRTSWAAHQRSTTDVADHRPSAPCRAGASPTATSPPRSSSLLRRLHAPPAPAPAGNRGSHASRHRSKVIFGAGIPSESWFAVDRDRVRLVREILDADAPVERMPERRLGQVVNRGSQLVEGELVVAEEREQRSPERHHVPLRAEREAARLVVVGELE